MSITSQIASVFSRIPADVQAPVGFERQSDSATTSSIAFAEPSSPDPDEGFRDPQLSRKITITLWVRGSGLTFAPQAGMYATWGGFTWNVLESDALAPAGVALHYKVTVQR